MKPVENVRALLPHWEFKAFVARVINVQTTEKFEAMKVKWSGHVAASTQLRSGIEESANKLTNFVEPRLKQETSEKQKRVKDAESHRIQETKQKQNIFQNRLRKRKMVRRSSSKYHQKTVTAWALT